MSSDPSAEFVRLWTRHQAEVSRYVRLLIPRAADAAEVVQDVSVLLWKKWARYDPERPFVPWAIRFAQLEVLKWRQRQAREKLVFSEELIAQIGETHDREMPLLEARRLALEGCLEKLTEKQRHIVGLRYGAEGTLKDEAERTGTTMHKLYYALEKIRLQLLSCVEGALRREGWSDA